MLFREFAEFCQIIEKISSTLEMTARVAIFIKRIEDDDDLYNVIHFLMGRIYPPWDERELGIGIGIIYEALEKISGLSKTKIEHMLKDFGDMGLVAENVLKKKRIATLAFEELTIKRVKEIFDEISSLVGEGSRKKKIMLLTGLYSSASPIEARYLTRLILRDEIRNR